MRSAHLACASIALLLAAPLFATPAEAFDNRRKGFVLAFGGGVQATSVDFDFNNSTDPPQEYFTGVGVGLALQIALGVGFTDQFAVTATHQVMSFDIDSERHTSFYLGVTATGWLRPSSRSLYGSLSLGRQSVLTNAYDGFFSNTATGYAGRVAIGYEFDNNLNLEGGLTLAQSERGFDRDGPRLETASAQIIAKWFWY